MATETLDARLGRVCFHKASKFSRSGEMFLIANTSNGVTVKGPMAKPIVGANYRLFGQWKTDPKYQEKVFAFDHHEIMIEQSSSGVAQHLADHVDGLGPARSTMIVDHFGDETLDILRADAERAREVPGLPVRQIDGIVKAIKTHFDTTSDPKAQITLIEMFADHRVPRKVVADLLADFKSNAPDMVRDRPYSILLAYPRMGWETVDKIALSPAVGYAKDGIDRQMAAIIESLERIASDGHTFCHSVECESAVHKLIAMRPAPEAWDALASSNQIILRETPKGREVALAKLDAAERSIAEDIARLAAGSDGFDFAIDDAGLHDEQKAAVEMVGSNGVSILTGKPGAGKSHVEAHIVARLLANDIEKIMVTAPTGKAAKRAAELIERACPGSGVPCTTIHKALKPTPGSDAPTGVPGESAKFGKGRDGFTWGHNEACPFEADFIVIDECFPAGTMVDTPSGPVDIATIRPGQAILNASGVDYVVATAINEVRRVIKINTGGTEIIASERHPFFTRRGLVFARDLEPGDSILQTAASVRLLRDDVDDGLEPPAPLLRSALQHAMANEVSRIPRSIHRRVSPQVGRRATEVFDIRNTGGRRSSGARSQPQTIFECRCVQEDFYAPQGDESSTTSPGWQRSWPDKAATAFLVSPRAEMDHRTSSATGHQGPRSGDTLQSRPGKSGTQDRNRGRRAVPQYSRETRQRSGEGCETSFARVDDVEILQSGDPRLDQFRDADGKLYFYDLEAARHHSFSVYGLLVHNCSMADVSLFASFLRAIPTGCNLLIVGDPHQLPSVGPGSVLRDLLASRLPSVTLDRIVRSDGGGRVIRACHAIAAGRRPEPGQEILLPTENWLHLECETPAEIVDQIVELHSPTRSFPDLFNDFQTIAPQHGGDIGTDIINQRLSAKLNPDNQDDDEANRLPFRIGDKIIRRKNGTVGRLLSADESPEDPDYLLTDSFRWQGRGYAVEETAIVNGDLGRVLDIVEGAKCWWIIVRLTTPDRLVRIDMGEHNLQVAYAISGHSSQGSGWPVVIIPVHPTAYYFNPKTNQGLWARPWIYTAMSRSEKLLVTVGDFRGIEVAINRPTSGLRNTRLKEYLASAIPNHIEEVPF